MSTGHWDEFDKMGEIAVRQKLGNFPYKDQEIQAGEWLKFKAGQSAEGKHKEQMAVALRAEIIATKANRTANAAAIMAAIASVVSAFCAVISIWK